MARTLEKILETVSRCGWRVADRLGGFLWLLPGCGQFAAIALLSYGLACTSIDRGPATHRDIPAIKTACPDLYRMAETLPPRGALVASGAVHEFSNLAGDCIEYFRGLGEHNREAYLQTRTEAEKGGFWRGFGASVGVFLIGLIGGLAL